ncbi:hypothetical protein N7537_010597 [Penicillium hordei]|uniref:Rhamnogalacturonase A/B/Epimerase-like pectate lyase domain-containing protein n=1 Tax=Penicillium hordei TaxID=40994 RepID=A0AAD6DVA3_9EURO|nr:uncharacterized protein N7537_010597 [Penicillium hordei]KAJ5593693.1 hypothetical protein N7537_010597 [Penicillium hordei]
MASSSTAGKVDQGGSHAQRCSYWLEDISHQGTAAFNDYPANFRVFRNVKDFGAKGDGVTDDTSAINYAIGSDNTCAPGSCFSSTTSQALVYFPPGTYMINSTIIQNYGVSLHGNPNCLPTIKAFPSFANGDGAMGMIDGNPSTYTVDVNIFFRQLRNFVIDTTLLPIDANMTGIRWPSAQATSIQNVIFNMPIDDTVQHVGLVGGGGEVFFTDLVFNGGHDGFIIPGGQHTLRNVTFNHCVNGLSLDAISTIVLQDGTFSNCSTAVKTTVRSGNVILVDSLMKDVGVGVASHYGSPSAHSNGLVFDNLEFDNVSTLVHTAGNTTALSGGCGTIVGWAQGRSFQETTFSTVQGPILPMKRPQGLLNPGSLKWYSQAKPGYDSLSVTSFISARSAGARGDGRADDTYALQRAIWAAWAQSKVLFLDHGSYKVTKTLYIPAHTKVVGEAYPNIFAAGDYFKSLHHPRPLLQVGRPGETGPIELSDLVLGTQGGTLGAILIEHNLASSFPEVGGYWDVHTRIGGWTGSELQAANCPKMPGVPKPPVDMNCMAAFMSMHATKSSSGIYMENCWLWAADHDIDDFNVTQIQIYTGRGILVESRLGNNWLIHTPVEHHSKYQYTFRNTRNAYMSQAQTEVPYYQPNPEASLPYPYQKRLGDPAFDGPVNGPSGAPRRMAWAHRFLDSHNITVYGASYFEYFNDWNQDCMSSNITCSAESFQIDTKSTGIIIYSFNSNAVESMITRDGIPLLAGPDQPNGLSGIFKDLAVYKQ